MSIQTVGFKGFKGLPDSETKLERLTLLVGKNGAGKTARAHALQLAILGFVPGMAKTNRDIMATFGNGEKLVVEVRRDGIRCSRGYFADKDGKVSEKFQLDLKRVTRDQYAVALGGVKLFDLGAFQKLSDQGKIDQTFALFPPGEGYRELEDQIEAKKADRNTLQKEIESLQTTAARLHQQRATIQLPSGTLAEIKAQIQEAETQLAMARQLAEQNRLEFAKAQAKERAELEAERAAERERCRVAEQQRIDQMRLAAQEKLNAEMEVKLRHQAELQAERERALSEKEVLPYCQPIFPPSMSPPRVEPITQSIQSILDTMQRTGCGACAAALVCRRELKKLREVA